MLFFPFRTLFLIINKKDNNITYLLIIKSIFGGEF